MKMTYTIEDYRNAVRELYASENVPEVKEQWLKLGLAIKQVVDNGDRLLIDQATEEFERQIFNIKNEEERQ